MQRRAVAMYLAFFLVVGGVAYGLIQTTAAPTVAMEGESYAEGDEVTLGERTWTVSSIAAESDGGGGGHGGGGGVTVSGELSWTDESAELETTIDNGSEVPPTDVVWDGQTARREATFEDGSTATDGTTTYEVAVNDSAGTLTLTNADDAADNETLEAEDTFQFRGFEATVTDISDGAATVVWGNPYLVVVETENDSEPTEATFVEQRNLTQLATSDPALYDEVITQDGVLKVTYRANDTNVAVTDYFDPAERHTVAEGETLQYEGAEQTVDAVDSEGITLTRTGEQTTTVDLAEGENVTIGDRQYFAHFPDNSSVQLFESDERYEEYHAQHEAIDAYTERKNGLWGVTQLSVVVAVLLIATALLPVKG